MGVSGLLNQLGGWSSATHLSSFRGKTLAIDGSSWLFKGCFKVARALSTGQATIGYLDFVVQRVELLRGFGIAVIVVFDGMRSPMKASTSMERKARQEANNSQGRHFLDQAASAKRRGDDAAYATLSKKADECFGRGISVTDDMVTTCIAALKQRGVRVVVAPYEADPQLVQLVWDGAADAVVTEDSDLLVYGALASDAARRGAGPERPVRLLLKLEASGAATELRWRPGELGTGDQQQKMLKSLRFYDFDGGGALFLHACLLGGTDYSRSLRGVGIVTAAGVCARFRSIPEDRRLESLVRFFRRDAAQKSAARKKGGAPPPEPVPADYESDMRRAECAFLSHPVWVVDRATLASPAAPPAGLRALEERAAAFKFGRCLPFREALRTQTPDAVDLTGAEEAAEETAASAEAGAGGAAGGATEGATEPAASAASAAADAALAAEQRAEATAVESIAGRCIRDAKLIERIAGGGTLPDGHRRRPAPSIPLSHGTYSYCVAAPAAATAAVRAPRGALRLEQVWRAAQPAAEGALPRGGAGLEQMWRGTPPDARAVQRREARGETLEDREKRREERFNDLFSQVRRGGGSGGEGADGGGGGGGEGGWEEEPAESKRTAQSVNPFAKASAGGGAQQRQIERREGYGAFRNRFQNVAESFGRNSRPKQRRSGDASTLGGKAKGKRLKLTQPPPSTAPGGKRQALLQRMFSK